MMLNWYFTTLYPRPALYPTLLYCSLLQPTHNTHNTHSEQQPAIHPRQKIVEAGEPTKRNETKRSVYLGYQSGGINNRKQNSKKGASSSSAAQKENATPNEQGEETREETEELCIYVCVGGYESHDHDHDARQTMIGRCS
jgi:hypothetical protein